MGIYGLMKYMNTICKNGKEPVDLEKIAKKYRKEKRKQPVILVDISSCVLFFAKMNFNDCFLEVEINLQESLEMFISKCFNIGVKLKFIGNGMKCPSAYNDWMNKKIAEYTEETRKTLFLKNATNKFRYRNVLSIVSKILLGNKKCEYIRALYDSAEWIIEYAKKYGCMAILSNDSNLVLVEGSEYFLSIPDLNVDTMCTYNLCRNNLAESLNIKPSDLPIFGAVQYSSCSMTDVTQKFLGAAKLVKKFYETDDLSEFDFPEFRQKLEFYTGSSQRVWTSSRNENWNRIINSAKNRHLTGISDKIILELMINRVIFLPPRDMLLKNIIVPSLRPLREKIYRIIFKEYPDKTVSVKEYTFLRNGKKVVSDIQDVYCERQKCGAVPSLLDLWSEDRSHEMMYQRRKLFCYTVSSQLTPEILDSVNIPQELLFPALVLFYMHWEVGNKLDRFQWSVFLTEIILASKNVGKRMNFENFKKINLDEIGMISPFLTTVDHLILLNSACGEAYSSEMVRVDKYFREALFKFVLEEIKTTNMKKFNYMKEEFNDLRTKLNKIAFHCGYSIVVN